MAILFPQKIGVYLSVNGDFSNQSTPEVILAGINNIGFRCYYTMDSAFRLPNDTTTPISWNPAFWDPASLTADNLAKAKASGNLIVGFNEPWNSFGGFRSTISPTNALDAWPALLALGNRLASPSVGPGFEDWLAQFMSGAASRGYRVDVINAHFYGGQGDSMDSFRNYLQNLHDLYSRPVIVTEWARANWANNDPTGTATFSFADQAAWATAGCQMMDGLNFVERHFWYGATQIFGTYQNNGAMDRNGTPTLIGQAFQSVFQSFVSPEPPPPISSSFAAIMNTEAIIINTDNGSPIPLPPFGTSRPSLSAICNARGINRRDS
jgi:hypothetical protein